MTTGVTVITVTFTRTHTGLKTPTGGLMVGMTTGLGRLMLLPLCLQHCHRLSLDHRPALQRAQLVSLKEELHLPHRTLYRTFQLFSSSVKVTDVETGETHSHVRPIPTSTG